MPRLSRPFVYSVAVAFLAVVWLAGPWPINSDTVEARRPEGEQLLDLARDALRDSREKLKRQPARVSEIGSLSAYDGEYFNVLDVIHEGQWPAHTDTPMFRDAPTAIVAAPKSPADGWGVMYFDWTTGRSIVEWFETEPPFVAGPD
jgi:hypothetical protein